MIKRTSLANAAVKRLQSPTSGPLRRRSSIVLKSSAVQLADNDDEAERAALRRNVDISAVLSPPPSNRRSLNVGAIIGDMSSPQIVEGLTECIKLNTQNKISMKNAFNLKMIDFMTYLVRKHDDGISNLQMAGTSLDVSAKIYALRVDGLHHDILQMIGNLDKGNNNDENADTVIASNDNEESQGPKRSQKKIKKKRTSDKIRTTIEALQGDVETVSLNPVMFGDSDCQTTDMLYQAMLPQHCGLGLGLHPYKDLILDDNSNDIANNPDDEPRIKWPIIDIDTSLNINTIPGGFEFLNWSEKDESNVIEALSQEASAIGDNLAFDLDSSLPNDNEPTEFTGDNFFDINDDNEENMEGFYAEKRPAQTIVSIINLMPEKKLEYSFFSDNINVRWIGPAHWKIKSGSKHLGSSNIMEACRQAAVRKKKEMTLNFTNTNINCEALTAPKKHATKVQAKTAKNTWSEKKLEPSLDNNDNTLKKLCQLRVRPNETINFTKNFTVLPNDNDEYNYDNENDTTNYCPNNEYDDIPADNDDVNDYDANPTSAGFEDNLIEIPKLTQKIFIPYSQRARKLDMRRLKKSIWNSLISKTQDVAGRENINIAERQSPLPVITKGVRFSDIHIDLPKKLSTNDSEELTFATSFVSLLHLANEKCLTIVSESGFSNVVITQDTI